MSAKFRKVTKNRTIDLHVHGAKFRKITKNRNLDKRAKFRNVFCLSARFRK